MVLFGAFCGSGGRAASVASVGGSDGVGNTVRGGALGRFTGGKVGDGFNCVSGAVNGGAVGTGVLSGDGVLR